RVVEQVERLHDAIDPSSAAQSKSPLEPQVHAVQRLLSKIVARHDGAIRPQATAASARLSEIGAVRALIEKAVAVEIEATQLETIPDLPDAVEDRPMLPAGPVRVAPEVGRHREGDIAHGFSGRIEGHWIRAAFKGIERLWVPLVSARHRVGGG